MSKVNWLEILNWKEEQIDDLRSLAISYIKQGIYDVALTFYNGLAVLTTPTVYDLQTIGALYLEFGNGVRALDYLDQALKLDPNHLPTKLNRTRALFLLGYKKQGLVQAVELEKSGDPSIATAASALVLAYH